MRDGSRYNTVLRWCLQGTFDISSDRLRTAPHHNLVELVLSAKFDLLQWFIYGANTVRSTCRDGRYPSSNCCYKHGNFIYTIHERLMRLYFSLHKLGISEITIFDHFAQLRSRLLLEVQCKSYSCSACKLANTTPPLLKSALSLDQNSIALIASLTISLQSFNELRAIPALTAAIIDNAELSTSLPTNQLP